MPFYAQNYAQNYALIMQNYALVIMLYAQLCKRDLLMHRIMTNCAHYVTSYAIICPNYAQLCTIMLKLCPKLCIIMPRNVQWDPLGVGLAVGIRRLLVTKRPHEHAPLDLLEQRR
jgi:hypothetical protein